MVVGAGGAASRGRRVGRAGRVCGGFGAGADTATACAAATLCRGTGLASPASELWRAPSACVARERANGLSESLAEAGASGVSPAGTRRAGGAADQLWLGG